MHPNNRIWQCENTHSSSIKTMRPTNEKEKLAVALLEKGTHPYTIAKELLETLDKKIRIEEITKLDRERHERDRDHGKKLGGFWEN